ncbi:MAG: rhodanese-like domain-containing protein [Gammaproteobacteria bacterium]
MTKPSIRLAVVLMALTSPLLLAQQASTSKLAAAATKEPAFKAHVLTVPELNALLAKPDKVLLIDVRRPDEVTSIGGFPAYFSVQASDLEKSLAWIPKDRTIVTVSNHASRAGKAADLLSSKGFKVAGAVGAETYEKDGGTIAHIKAPAPKS